VARIYKCFRILFLQGFLIHPSYKKRKKDFFFFGKLTYVLKEEDTNIIRGIPQIYNDNRNIKQQMATG
jgi:hypothetical protein